MIDAKKIVDEWNDAYPNGISGSQPLASSTPIDHTNIASGCKSWLCPSCKHYCKFLSVSTMHIICWNKGVKYEER